MNPQAWFPTYTGDNFGEAQGSSRNANANLTQDTLNWWQGVQQQQAGALNRAAGQLRGTNRANIRDIDKQFTRLSGDTAQGLIDRGLGNSTIQYSMDKGITNARSDAMSRNRAEFGNKMYEAYAKNAMANSGLASQQLSYLGNIDIGYPDRTQYQTTSAYDQMFGQAASGGGGGGMSGASRPMSFNPLPGGFYGADNSVGNMGGGFFAGMGGGASSGGSGYSWQGGGGGTAQQEATDYYDEPKGEVDYSYSGGGDFGGDS